MWLLSIAQSLVMATAGAQPGVAANPASTNLPDPIPTRQTYFAIPFEIDQVDHPVVGAAEIKLYVSRDRGATWQHETSVAPTTKQFLYRASGDGEYWFAVQTRDKAGNFRPPLIKSPGLRVVVDTQAPGLSIDAQRGQAGQIIADWKIDEAHIKPDTLKIQYRVGDSQQWETVAVDPATIHTDSQTNSGETIWWAPAGQGRIEIRAEVADAAGNRNVSHAQVTTIAATSPSEDVMARTPQNNMATTSQSDWQASSGQNAWSQQNNYSTQQTPSQTASPYEPYGRDYGNEGYENERRGSGAASMAAEPAMNSNSYSNSEPAYSGGSSAYGYDVSRGSSAERGYGIGTDTTAQTTQPSGRSQPYEQPQYGQSSQNRQQQAQNPYGQYQAPTDYGSSTTPESNSTWPGSSNYGAQNRPNVGTVAAQPAPAYKSQYDPYGTSTQTSAPSVSNGYNSSTGYGSSAQQKATASQPVRTVNTKIVDIAYTNPAQPMSVARVELWGTRDGGYTWKSFGYDSDTRSPILARVPDEGTYGFVVVFHPMNGPPVQPPRRGQTPNAVVRVDLTRPDARLIGVDRSMNAPNQLTVRWQAADAQLADAPISLYYADASTGQWRLIARNLNNSGEYRWNLPIGLPPEVQIRVDAEDAAGNVATAETRRPIRLAAGQESRGGAPSYSVEVQNVQPAGQASRPAPHRYYIR